MLKKLLKYDLKWILKVEYIWSAITIIFAVLTRLTSLLNESVITSIIKAVLTSITITGMLNVLFNGVIRTWVRVKNNLYKDEAYLTHTLPVESKTILSSKVLAGIITTLYGVAIITISFFIAFYNESLINYIKESMQIVATTLNSSITKILLILFIILFLEFTFILMVGITGIIKGHEANNGKVIKSVLYSGIYWMSFSALSLLIIYLISLANKDMNALFTGAGVISYSALKLFLLLVIIIYTIYIIVLYFISKHELNKGVNID
mgnify:FL=1